jgi:hypothetical protein
MYRRMAVAAALLYGFATVIPAGIAVLRRAGSEDPPYEREQLAVNLGVAALFLGAVFVFGVIGTWRLRILVALWAAHFIVTLATVWALDWAGLRGTFVWPLAAYELLGLVTLLLLSREAGPAGPT